MTLDFSISTAMLAAGLASAVLALALLYLSTVPEAPPATRWWAAGFALNTARYLVRLCGGVLTMAQCDFISESLHASAAVLLVVGTLQYGRTGSRPLWALVALPLMVGWAAGFTLVHPHFLLLNVPLYGFSGLAMLYAGWEFIRRRPPGAGPEHAFVGGAFMVWGLHKLDYPLFAPIASTAPWGFTVAAVLSMVIAVGLIILVQRRQQSLAEQATRRAQASEAHLQESEARYRQLVENSVMGVCIHRDGTPLYANPAYLRIYGFSSFDEIAAGNVFERTLHPDDVPRVRAYARERLRGGSPPEHYAIRGRRVDGTPLWLHNSACVITWQGEPAVQSILFDVTEQKRAEEELRASQRLLRIVIDSVPHFISVRDRDARLLMVNRALETALGLPLDTYLHKDPIEANLRERSEADLFLEQCLAVVRTEAPLETDYEITLKGQRRRFQTVRTPLRGDDGSVVGVVSVSMDITEQKRAEEELRASQRLLRTVIDSIPHSVLVRDRQGRVVMANRTWQRSARCDPADFLYKSAPELGLYEPEEAAEIHAMSLQVVASEQPIVHEHERSLPHGRRHYSTIRTPLRGEGDRVVGVVSVSLDITEQRAMEAQLRQSQKMEAVGQLTGGVAHDFNNLLSIILGNLELLESRVESDPRALGYAQRAMKATERGAALTQRLLAFSRRQTLQPRPVDLAHHVDELLDLLRSSLGETIRIETACDPGAGVTHVDPVQLENTLLNLAFNARDAMPEGGTLAISARAADDRSLPGFPAADGADADWILLTVRDTGRGMAPDVLARAVEPFFTTKGPSSGSGLGLSMIYGFMNQSGGHLHIESEEGAGTTVRLYFRRCAGPAEATPERPAPSAPRATAETVLVVEDDPALGRLAVEMLAELNCSAMTAADGHEALRALRENPHIGLLFTDVVLPNGMDGVMLAEEARRLRPEIKVLFTSGYAETVFERHPSELAGTALLHKPYRLGDLAEKLSGVLHRPAGQHGPAA